MIWLWCMWRAKRAYGKLGFAARLRFLDALRPPLKGELVIAYPDAIFHVTAADICRALKSTDGQG